MSSFAILLTAGLHLSICQASCIAPYKLVHGACLHHPDNARTNYCEAQAYCSSVGGELIHGNNYLAIAGRSFTGMPRNYWIGVTDLNTERRGNKNGWMWTNGSEAAISGLWFGASEPSTDGGTDCVVQCYGTRYLCDLWCHTFDAYWQAEIRAPMCQPRAQPSAAVRSSNFEASAIINTGLVQDFADGGGCSRTVSGVGSKLECAAACGSDPGDWCAAFYFNKATRQCLLVMYTNANIDVGDASAWVKMTKKL